MNWFQLLTDDSLAGPIRVGDVDAMSWTGCYVQLYSEPIVEITMRCKIDMGREISHLIVTCYLGTGVDTSKVRCVTCWTRKCRNGSAARME